MTCRRIWRILLLVEGKVSLPSPRGGGQLWPTDWIVGDAGIVIALYYTIYDIV